MDALCTVWQEVRHTGSGWGSGHRSLWRESKSVYVAGSWDAIKAERKDADSVQ